jgi:hypothetical protein
MKYWIIILWLPFGRIYMIAVDIYRSGETWHGLFHKRIYRQLIIESGIFGPLTPIMDKWLQKSFPKKEVKGGSTLIEMQFKL